MAVVPAPNDSHLDAASFIKSKWVSNQLRDRAGDFTTTVPISVLSGTWNVNGKKPSPDEDLLLWLRSHGNPSSGPDFYCLGFQEIVDLTTVNVVADTKTRERSSLWVQHVLQAVNGIGAYEVVHVKHLVGIMVCILAKREHLPFITRVQSQSVGVGVMGVMGNKGGAAVRLKFHDSNLCFVSAHFAAHRDNVEGRNSDFANVLARMRFVHEAPSAEEVDRLGTLALAKLVELEETGRYGSEETNAAGQRLFKIMDHDVVIFLGDFNYRIVQGMSTEEVFEKIDQKDWECLRENDQLNVERRLGNVFRDFKEGFGGATPPFEPTYKFQPKTSLYERRPDKKLRAPGWCDRILWHAKDWALVKQLSYEACAALEMSDHKPVASLFMLECRSVILDRKRAVYQQVLHTLDKFENDSQPKVSPNSS